ncbi:hypothetical protein D3C73_1341780 [compost metagenome]
MVTITTTFASSAGWNVATLRSYQPKALFSGVPKGYMPMSRRIVKPYKNHEYFIKYR